jgi:hypothetical protein
VDVNEVCGVPLDLSSHLRDHRQVPLGESPVSGSPGATCQEGRLTTDGEEDMQKRLETTDTVCPSVLPLSMKTLRMCRGGDPGKQMAARPT